MYARFIRLLPFFFPLCNNAQSLQGVNTTIYIFSNHAGRTAALQGKASFSIVRVVSPPVGHDHTCAPKEDKNE